MKRVGRPRLVHIGRGLYVHPTYAKWFHLQSKPQPRKLRK